MEQPAKRAKTEFFPTISKICFEGPQSTNPLAFKYYQPDELILGKKMRLAKGNGPFFLLYVFQILHGFVSLLIVPMSYGLCVPHTPQKKLRKIVPVHPGRDWCRFAVSWWHTFNGQMGTDPFSNVKTHLRPWDVDGSMDTFLTRVDVAFEFFTKPLNQKQTAGACLTSPSMLSAF